MIRSILAAAALSLGLVSVAVAFTPSPATSPNLAVTSDLVQVGHKGHKGGHKSGKWHPGKWHDKRWKNAHRYSHAPKGWKHYNYRPYRWSHRGCVVIGNLWYCP
jgi:hypothetical protein